MDKQTFKQLSSDVRAKRSFGLFVSAERKQVEKILNSGRSDYLAERVIAKSKHFGAPYWYLVDTAPERITRRLGF